MKKAEKLVLESPLATDTSPAELLRLWAELAVATVGDFRGKKKPPQCVGMATFVNIAISLSALRV